MPVSILFHNLGSPREVGSSNSNNSPEQCCIDSNVPNKCLGMCKRKTNRVRGKSLTNMGSCRKHWKSIKRCVTQDQKGKFRP